MIPSHPDLPRDAAVARRQRVLADRLARMGVRPAPELPDGDVARLREADTLLVQVGRAARHTTGTVRAYASLIDDANDDNDTTHWVARIDRSMGDLDAFAARMGTLRICDRERPSMASWEEMMSCVVTRCSGIAPCTVEVVDRTQGPFRQRAELLGRTLVHLVRNAIEAMPRAGRVRVRVDESRHDGERIFHVRVADDGPSWEPDASQDIWRPYVTTRPDHAGLGLAFVAVCAPIVGGAAGIRREADRTVAHLLVPEEGGLEWES
jgi:nitrogen-specific signal transduction histidine kinase